MHLTCLKCRFWSQWPSQPINKTEHLIGDCRRHAPVLVPVLMQSGPVTLHVTAAQMKTKWPTTLDNWFCGECRTQGDQS